MLVYPEQLNPVAITIGGLKVHWYGLMYLCGFLFFLYAGKWRLKKFGHQFLTPKLIDDLFFYIALGVVIGGRLGFCLFYRPDYYFEHIIAGDPLEVIRIWHGGMSFHGGMLGVFVATYVFARQHKHGFFVVSDFIAPLVPFGIMCGRIGNFINGELWGRLCSVNLPWGMIFPQSGVWQPRHPSQIYEALGEGLLLMIILWLYAAKPRQTGKVSAIFMIGYGLIRFGLEFFRKPDEFATNAFNLIGLSLGQLYSVPMVIFGIWLWLVSNRSRSS